MLDNRALIVAAAALSASLTAHEQNVGCVPNVAELASGKATGLGA